MGKKNKNKNKEQGATDTEVVDKSEDETSQNEPDLEVNDLVEVEKSQEESKTTPEKVNEKTKENSDSKPEKASEAIFDDGSDDFVQVDKPDEESKTTPDKDQNVTEFASALLTPDKEDSGGTEPLRKSLDGLSPSQDAKVGTLKQMFQDYDQEILCSILFEQCNGNLDASIETILKMQSSDGTEETNKDSVQE